MGSVTHTVGEILLPDGKSLLKMWDVQISPGARDFTRHSHTRFEIAVVGSGEGVYRTAGDVYPMRPGDVFVFSSNEVHCVTGVSDGGMTLTNLHFEPRYLTETRGDDPFIRLCFSHAPQFRNRIPAEAARVLRETLRGIREELLGGGAYFPEAVRARLDLALIELLRHHGYGEGETPVSQQSAYRNMLSVFGYIDAHLDGELRLAELAAVAGYSPNYFSHLFGEINGLSLWDYITAKRVERGVRMITSGEDLTMTEVAMRCGFNSSVNFNRAFKRQKGITPGALKRNPGLLAH